MDALSALLEIFLHTDRHLADAVATYGAWVYALLFAIIFLETGVVVTPFLPGDSLLFAAGVLAAAGLLDLGQLIILLTLAAIVGDSVNYRIGRAVGARAFGIRSRWLRHEHLLRAQQFYNEHGGKTIVLARFLPVIRTFAPFIAGIGRMDYRRFALFNVGGAMLWVTLLTLLGYFLGSQPLVKENLSFAILTIVALSLLPVVHETWRRRLARRAGR